MPWESSGRFYCATRYALNFTLEFYSASFFDECNVCFICLCVHIIIFKLPSKPDNLLNYSELKKCEKSNNKKQNCVRHLGIQGGPKNGLFLEVCNSRIC